MEQQKQVVMTDQLAKHIAALKSKLAVMGYRKYTLRHYEKVYDTLLKYVESGNTQVFSSEYCQSFIEETYGTYYGNKHDRWRVTRPMTVLIDFIRLGVIIRQKNGGHSGKSFSQGYKELFDGFLTSQAERGLSPASVRTIRSRLFKLENFLLDLGVKVFSEITRETVNLYIDSFISRSTSTSSTSLRELGRLCDYALSAGFHTESFASMIPRVKNIRRQRLPHTCTTEEIKRLIEVVDRNNPIGKRDYAMILLAARLGFRAGDVRTLTFPSIDWTKKTISIIQEKTKKFLELPLPDDVGWAIIDYLKNGRPVCNNDIVFVSHTPPYFELNQTSGNLVAKYMRKAGIKTPQGRVSGMHTLRHSLASGMLAEGIALPTISSVLGHADITSTESYLRVDVSSLRKCALEVDV
jgi:site-specific recombinase XerD